jgi:methionyl-tRNA synthetase
MAPWHIKAKEGVMTEEEAALKIQVVCRSVLEAMYVVAHFLSPIIPAGAQVIADRLGTPLKVNKNKKIKIKKIKNPHGRTIHR